MFVEFAEMTVDTVADVHIKSCVISFNSFFVVRKALRIEIFSG